MLSTADIYQQFDKGDMSAFYSVVYPGLIVWAAHILGDDLAFLAEDCVQDAVFETYNHRSEIDSAVHWRLYLYTAVRNKAIGFCRRAQTHKDYAERSNDDPLVESVETVIIEHEVFETLSQVVATLTDRERELFRLCYDLGMRNADIAERLGVAEITVKKQKASLLATLRHRLATSQSSVMAYAILLATDCC